MDSDLRATCGSRGGGDDNNNNNSDHDHDRHDGAADMGTLFEPRELAAPAERQVSRAKLRVSSRSSSLWLSGQLEIQCLSCQSASTDTNRHTHSHNLI